MTTTQTKIILLIEYTFFGLMLSDIEILAKIGCSILVGISTLMIIFINFPKFWNRVKEIKKKFK